MSENWSLTGCRGVDYGSRHRHRNRRRNGRNRTNESPSRSNPRAAHRGSVESGGNGMLRPERWAIAKPTEPLGSDGAVRLLDTNQGLVGTACEIPTPCVGSIMPPLGGLWITARQVGRWLVSLVHLKVELTSGSGFRSLRQFHCRR